MFRVGNFIVHLLCRQVSWLFLAKKHLVLLVMPGKNCFKSNRKEGGRAQLHHTRFLLNNEYWSKKGYLGIRRLCSPPNILGMMMAILGLMN